MNEQDFLIKKLSFTQRPIPVPADYRPMFKIAILVLTLKLCCRAATSNLLKLHLFSWALSSDKNQNTLRRFIESNFESNFSVWGIEPALNRALQFAVAEDICQIIDGRKYKLTEKGLRFYEMINADRELFMPEKKFLNYVGKSKITDTRINEMSNQWKIIDAEN